MVCVKKLRWSFAFLENDAFWERLQINFLRLGFESILESFNFRVKDSELKSSLQSPKESKSHLTKHGVICKILEMIIIRDLGMEINFLCCVFKYVPAE